MNKFGELFLSLFPSSWVSSSSSAPASGLPASGLPASGLPASGLPASGVPISAGNKEPKEKRRKIDADHSDADDSNADHSDAYHSDSDFSNNYGDSNNDYSDYSDDENVNLAILASMQKDNIDDENVNRAILESMQDNIRPPDKVIAERLCGEYDSDDSEVIDLVDDSSSDDETDDNSNKTVSHSICRKRPFGVMEKDGDHHNNVINSSVQISTNSAVRATEQEKISENPDKESLRNLRIKALNALFNFQAQQAQQEHQAQ